MAKESENIQGVSLKAAGMDDTQPCPPLQEMRPGEPPPFYQTRGVFRQVTGALEKVAGKELLRKESGAILNMHGDLANVVFVETSNRIIMIPILEGWNS
jgi:hypothetical protein